MRFLVFSQSPRPSLPGSLALTADVEVDERTERPDAPLPACTLRLSNRRSGAAGSFDLVARPTRHEDRDAARLAATRGEAAGMDALAARCPTIVEVTSTDAPQALCLSLCAAIAAEVLGPILPPDAGTLLGVRTARRLAER